MVSWFPPRAILPGWRPRPCGIISDSWSHAFALFPLSPLSQALFSPTVVNGERLLAMFFSVAAVVSEMVTLMMLDWPDQSRGGEASLFSAGDVPMFISPVPNNFCALFVRGAEIDWTSWVWCFGRRCGSGNLNLVGPPMIMDYGCVCLSANWLLSHGINLESSGFFSSSSPLLIPRRFSHRKAVGCSSKYSRLSVPPFL